MSRDAFRRTCQALIHLLVLRPFVKLVFGASAEGREHLRGLEQFIIVANHNSHLDVLLLFQLLSPRQLGRTRVVAAFEYFCRSRALFGAVGLLFRPVWVVRHGGEAAVAASPVARRAPAAGAVMDEMRAELRRGGSLIIFPEGTRGEPGAVAPFHSGVGRLAIEFPHVPIVPVLITGAERALPRSSGVPVPLWTRFIVAPPQRFAAVPDDAATLDTPAAAEAEAAGIAATLERLIRDLAAAERAARHRRGTRRRRPPAFAVLGIDGSGKSTLSRLLAQRLSADTRGTRVCLVSDDVVFYERGAPLRLQPLAADRLRTALGRHAKTARSLKSYRIPKLAELLLRDHVIAEVRRWYDVGAVVLDGAPLLNLAAWAKVYRAAELDDASCAAALRVLTAPDRAVARRDPVLRAFPELAALVRLRLPPLTAPDVVFFLDVAPAVSLERIGRRGEARQVHETEEKLTQLRGGYATVCRVLEPALGVPVHVLDGTRPLDALLDEAAAALQPLLAAAASVQPDAQPAREAASVQPDAQPAREAASVQPDAQPAREAAPTQPDQQPSPAAAAPHDTFAPEPIA
jgi:1-acyl-sn-glycerol-3-phosphate acyltransferase